MRVPLHSDLALSVREPSSRPVIPAQGTPCLCRSRLWLGVRRDSRCQLASEVNSLSQVPGALAEPVFPYQRLGLFA